MCFDRRPVYEACLNSSLTTLSQVTNISKGAFIGLIFVSAAAGFSPPDYKIPSYKQSDKALHFVAFFLLTLCFYWILETSRRKVLQLTFTVCTLGLGLASEVVQGLLPVSRFRIWEIV